MFLCVLFLCRSAGSFNMLLFSNDCGLISVSLCVIVLGVLFITKIPLFPFHCWLPVVHAESPSSVSVCLRGYIMKLGVLGVYRFCFNLLPGVIFSFEYSVIVMCASFLFFLLSCFELDGKRWLAFLRLAHISIVCLAGCVCEYHGIVLP